MDSNGHGFNGGGLWPVRGGRELSDVPPGEKIPECGICCIRGQASSLNAALSSVRVPARIAVFLGVPLSFRSIERRHFGRESCEFERDVARLFKGLHGKAFVNSVEIESARENVRRGQAMYYSMMLVTLLLSFCAALVAAAILRK